MRVTQSMLSNNMLRNLSNSYSRLGKYQEQITSQKKISRPSDDPLVAMKGITYRRNLQEVQQYQRNFGEAYNWVDNADSSLDKAGLALDRIRELTVQVSNDTYDATQRKAAAEEIKQLRNHLVNIANTKVGEKYLFNGTDTLKAPVTDGTPPTFNSPRNNGDVELELSKGIYIPVNVKPEEAFDSNLFKEIDDLIITLEDPSKSGSEVGQYLEVVDKHKANVLNARADLGARANRIELMEDRVDTQEVISTKAMSENEDIDFEKVITELIAQESVHRAALSIGARIIQPSLMDFLR
ncbi:flagellar hook-associated protein FlgL [Bacillus sp. PK3_68]|uniref:flagellar hook-associated protein FlgL n=1 Tax=Bacillus sp. PK3_68 TaxID=2027408 RepID=UPI000E750DC6|nr:flagellar hook-associated protein FlgL [Bacillus sp. PK3_68]RJS60541.1 flagellar hook-associated protein FlgL [Bacillus sp. PK3_68]